jgi:Winged helix DNA-binding domain
MPRHRSGASGDGPVLDRLALNRALLARQHLVERTSMPTAAMVEHLVGMQAQLPEDPYLGLWSRIDAFDPESLSTLIAEREAVRIAGMRSTIHLMTAGDALILRPLTQGVLERALRSNQLKLLGGVDLAELDALARQHVAEKPRTSIELGRLLAERWPERDASTLSIAARTVVPLVQVPPRGLWGGRGRPTVTDIETWLGHPLEPQPSIDAITVRYLRAFGPASAADMRTWSGIAGLREAFERLRPTLRTFRDERGRELFDIEDGLLPDPTTPAPVRFLPVYDNLVLSHDDRSRVVPPELGAALPVGQENIGSVLIEGYIGARWRMRREKRSLRMIVELMRPIVAESREELEAEGQRVVDFLARDATEREVVVMPSAR